MSNTLHLSLKAEYFGALRDERQLRECTPPEDRPRAEPNVAIRTDKLIADINAWLYARAADESTRAPDGWTHECPHSTAAVTVLATERCTNCGAAPPSGERPSAPAPEGEKR